MTCPAGHLTHATTVRGAALVGRAAAGHAAPEGDVKETAASTALAWSATKPTLPEPANVQPAAARLDAEPASENNGTGGVFVTLAAGVPDATVGVIEAEDPTELDPVAAIGRVGVAVGDGVPDAVGVVESVAVVEAESPMETDAVGDGVAAAAAAAAAMSATERATSKMRMSESATVAKLPLRCSASPLYPR